MEPEPPPPPPPAYVPPPADAAPPPPPRRSTTAAAAGGWVAALPLAIALATAATTTQPAPRAARPQAGPTAAGPAVAAPAEPLAAAAVGPDEPDVMVAHFIDVGQASATLLEFSCGAILIDAGAQDRATIPRLTHYLDEFFDDRPDLDRTLAAIVITHNHIDHTRALREVVEMEPAIKVARFIENGRRGAVGDQGDFDVKWLVANHASGGLDVNVVQVHQAMVESTDGFTSGDVDPVACSGRDPEIRMLWSDLAQNPGWDVEDFRDKNNGSIVLRVDFGESSFLFTGDLEEPAIEEMVALYDGSDTLDVDVWEVGHHGSYNGTTESLLAAATPQIAVISMSRFDDQRANTAWAYGHPREPAVQLLREAITRRRNPSRSVHVAQAIKRFFTTTMSDAIYGTGWDGTVKIRADADGKLRVTLGR